MDAYIAFSSFLIFPALLGESYKAFIREKVKCTIVQIGFFSRRIKLLLVAMQAKESEEHGKGGAWA